MLIRNKADIGLVGYVTLQRQPNVKVAAFLCAHDKVMVMSLSKYRYNAAHGG